MMDKWKRKFFKGFTLIEIIIAMLISSILLGIAFKVLLSLMSIDNQHSKETSNSNKVLTTYSILREISLKAIKISNPIENKIDFLYEHEKLITVSFIPSAIIIEQDYNIDTVQFSWNNLRIISVDPPVKGLINEFSFNIQSNSIDYPILIKKEYPKQLLYELQNE
jgi:prepilin-type N-terminal cleavage/methylation domain-containing protein